MNKQLTINLLVNYLADRIRQRRKQGKTDHEHAYQLGLLMGIIYSLCWYDTANWRRVKDHIERNNK